MTGDLSNGQPGSHTQSLIDYQRHLNEAQFRAVTHLNGPHLVIAGAGTGKTRTLVYRVAYLVEQGIDPRSILLLTFTRKSAQEMMHRASGMLDDRCSMVSGGTFHSFANMVLRKYAALLGYHSNFTIVDRSDAQDILGFLRTELGFHKKQRAFPRKETLLNIISRSTNTSRPFADIVLEDYPQFESELDNITKVQQDYLNYKLSRSIMDYDDLLLNLKRLLEEQQAVRKNLSETYRYIMVDEYQDTNKLQGVLVKLLASEHGNVMVVGDDSQSIYSFRGANFRNIMDFPKIFSDCTITTLEQNYRSTQPILSLTNAIIANARERYSKVLFSEIKEKQKPVYLRPTDKYQEAHRVCFQIENLLANGTQLGDIAVLFRAGWHSNELEVELAGRHIPFVKYGGLKFVESAHIKDLLAFLRAAFNPLDAVAWRRALLLLEGVGESTANKIIREIIDSGEGYEALKAGRFAKKRYGEALRRLFELVDQVHGTELSPARQLELALDFYTPLFGAKYDDYHKRANDLVSLAQMAGRYQSLEKLLSDLTLEPPEQSQIGTNRRAEATEKLTLSTIHSAKGLEWQTVFIIHLVEGCLPASQSFGSDESIEEERRLFYVAATRAKRQLYLSAPIVTFGRLHFGSGSSSRFLFEIQDLRKLVNRL